MQEENVLDENIPMNNKNTNIHNKEKNDRMVILHLMVHLYNFQASQVGINQILNSFCDKTSYFGKERIDNDANAFL